jgi:hypothetical protein
MQIDNARRLVFPASPDPRKRKQRRAHQLGLIASPFDRAPLGFTTPDPEDP